MLTKLLPGDLVVSINKEVTCFILEPCDLVYKYNSDMSYLRRAPLTAPDRITCVVISPDSPHGTKRQYPLAIYAGARVIRDGVELRPHEDQD